MPVNEFNEMNDLEVMAFRGNIMYMCNDVLEEQKQFGDEARARSVYPPDLHSTSELPKHLVTKIQMKGRY